MGPATAIATATAAGRVTAAAIAGVTAIATAIVALTAVTVIATRMDVRVTRTPAAIVNVSTVGIETLPRRRVNRCAMLRVKRNASSSHVNAIRSVTPSDRHSVNA